MAIVKSKHAIITKTANRNAAILGLLNDGTRSQAPERRLFRDVEFGYSPIVGALSIPFCVFLDRIKMFELFHNVVYQQT